MGLPRNTTPVICATPGTPSGRTSPNTSSRSTTWNGRQDAIGSGKTDEPISSKGEAGGVAEEVTVSVTIAKSTTFRMLSQM